MRHRLARTTRAVAVAAVLLVMTLAARGSATARPIADATATHTLTSGTWKAAPSSTTFSFAASVLPPPQYFNVANTGSLDLVGATYALSVTGLSVGTVSVRACTLAWNESLNLCGGVVTTIVTNVNSPQSVTGVGLYPASAGSSIRLQIIDSAANASAVTATLTISVARSQVRAATTTSS
jgi:hypothetical protein